MGSKDRIEYGQVYTDPALKLRPGDMFRTQGQREPFPDEIALKAYRSSEVRYDPYGFYDPKMGAPSLARVNRQILLAR